MPAVAAAAVLAALYLLLDPPSADLAAQTYRTGLFERVGWAAWDNHWYGGHHLPGYSVLFPPLGAALGAGTVAALSVVGATAAVARLAPAPAASWFAAGMAATVVSGRLAFALGAAAAAWAVLAAHRGRTALAGAGGALTALCSPVAALFAALIAAALWLQRRGRAPVALAAGAVAVTATLVALFPEGGTEPFVASAFWPALAATLLFAAGAGGAVRAGAILYALVLVAAFAVDSPLGGNAARLGALLGGPLAVALIRDRRRLALAAIPLAYWTLYPPVRDWAQAQGDPARQVRYYDELLGRLGGVQRLEIPFTKGHWEAAHVAGAPQPVMLARGWERQLDRKVNALFYDGGLTAGRYEAWLRDNAVSHVAVPDAELDDSAREEAALIAAGLPYLRELWRGRHWTLYAVRDATPLGAEDWGPDWFVAPAGVVRMRWTPYWQVVEGRGCVRRAGDWTRVESARTVRVAIRFDPLRALSNGRRCG